MKLKSFVAIVGGSAVVAMLVGCAKVPQAEIDKANADLSAAKAAEADVYVVAQYSAAQESLNVALAAIEKQKSAFALTRNYDAAKATLKAASDIAAQALNAAAAEKEKVKAEATQAVTDAQAAVTAAKALLAKAPKGKEGKAALEAMSAELGAVEASITEANTDIANSAFMAARDKAVAAKAKVDGIAQELTAAIEKAKPAKGKKK